MAGFRTALDELGFTEIQTPKIVATATECGANVFALDYFGRPAYLAQSPQFYKQTMVGVFERVYEIGPVFRAEPHDTARHLAEYVSLDAELGFIEDHRDVMAVLRDVLAGMVDAVHGRRPRRRSRLERDPARGARGDPGDPLRRRAGADRASRGGDPRASRTSRRPTSAGSGDWARTRARLGLRVRDRLPDGQATVLHPPRPGRPGFSNSFDLLFRGLELVTGGQRLHRYADYVAALAARGETRRLRRLPRRRSAHGMPPHGGFAIGLERWTARLTGAANIREATLFPRDLHRLTP